MYKQSIFASLALTILSLNVVADGLSEKLDDLVVTAKSDKAEKDISATVTIITAEDIAKINAVDIKDVLLKQVGIVELGGQLGTGGTFVSIRGTRETDTLFLIDGKRGNNTAGYIESSTFQYNMVPLDAIERIEIIKGAKSSIYGSDAMGGVVNIITKKDKRAFYGSIDVKAGTSSAKHGGDEQSYSANIGGNISDKLYMFLDVNKTNRDASGDNTGTYIQGLDSTSGIVKLKYDIDDTQNIYASYIKGEDKRKDYGGLEPYDTKRDIYTIGYEKVFEKVALNLDYTKAKTETKGRSSVFVGTHDFETDTLKAESKISALDYNYIVLGAEASKEQYSRFEDKTSINQEFDRKMYNYYIQDEIEIKDFIFTLGANLDDNDKYGTEWSPNAGAVYKVDDKQRLKINYSEGFKAPTLTQGDSGYISDKRPIPLMRVIHIGNDDLKPETSKSYELAYEFYGEDTTFKAAVFRTDFKDMIDGKEIQKITPRPPSPINPMKYTYQYSNIEEANIKGFETDLKYDFNDNHTLTANYTYLKTEDETTNEELRYRPKNTVNIALSSNLYWGISTYLSANYIGKQYITSTDKASGYTTFDAQVSKKITKDLTARIGVNNIGDKKLDDSDLYSIERRLIYAGLNYKF